MLSENAWLYVTRFFFPVLFLVITYKTLRIRSTDATNLETILLSIFQNHLVYSRGHIKKTLKLVTFNSIVKHD